MRNLQFTDECECIDIFTAVENFDELVLKVTDVRLEIVDLSNFDSEEMVVILLSLPARGVLGDERFDYFLEIMERTRQ